MKIIAFLLSLNLTISACSLKNASPTFKTYSTEVYSIQYPDSWRIDTMKQDVEFVIFSPKEDGQDKFSENINLLIQDLSGNDIDLDKYANISETQIRQNAVDLKHFVMTKVESTLYDYYKLSYNMRYETFKLFTEQFYFVKDAKAYVITFSSEDRKSKDIGEKILNSFTFAKSTL